LFLGPITGYCLLPPDKLKAGLQHLGSNLTDREFEYLLQKVGKSHDGKISLSEFDRIINSTAVDYDVRHRDAQRERRREREPTAHPLPLPLPPNHSIRYSDSSYSCDIIGQPGIPEFDLLSSGKTGRMAGAVWDNLRRLMQSKSAFLPEAFSNVAKCSNLRDHTHTPDAHTAHERECSNMREFNRDTRGKKHGSGLGSYSRLKTSRSLDGMETGARSRVCHLGSHGSPSVEPVRGYHSSSNNNISSSNNNSSSSNNNSSSSNNNIGSSYNNSRSSSGGGSGKEVWQGSAGAAQSTACVPISQIRNVLSDSGVQLGTEDAMRLCSMLVRKLSVALPPQTQTQTQSEDREGDLLISLDQFCDIVGIPVDGQTATHNRGHSLCTLVQPHK
jgi:hypothetical protein